VTFDPATKAILAAVPDDEPALRHRLGIAANEKVGDNYQEAMNLPTLNVSAMKAGEPESHRSVIPASATAWFDLRTVPATPARANWRWCAPGWRARAIIWCRTSRARRNAPATPIWPRSPAAAGWKR
jgi:acetylornithine deacetylase/succinyl-diaminopimelate desuccinylase-like protein